VPNSANPDTPGSDPDTLEEPQSGGSGMKSGYSGNPTIPTLNFINDAHDDMTYPLISLWMLQIYNGIEGERPILNGIEDCYSFQWHTRNFLHEVGLFTLLEKWLKAPVGKALWYRFLEPVPRKRYQRLKSLVPGKITGI